MSSSEHCITLTSEPLPRDTDPTDVRMHLVAELRARVIEADWNPNRVTLDVWIPDYDADLFIRNQYRLVAEARLREVSDADHPRS